MSRALGLSEEGNEAAWEIDRVAIHITEKMGAGKCSEVWKGLFNNTTVVEVKILKPGILLYELFTYGSFPYIEMTNAQVLRKLESGYCLPCPNVCPDQLYEIMVKC